MIVYLARFSRTTCSWSAASTTRAGAGVAADSRRTCARNDAGVESTTGPTGRPPANHPLAASASAAQRTNAIRAPAPGAGIRPIEPLVKRWWLLLAWSVPLSSCDGLPAGLGAVSPSFQRERTCAGAPIRVEGVYRGRSRAGGSGLDRALVDRARAGDREAYDASPGGRHRTVPGRVRILAISIAQGRRPARARRHLARPAEAARPDQFEAWAYRVVTRTSLDEARQRRRHGLFAKRCRWNRASRTHLAP